MNDVAVNKMNDIISALAHNEIEERYALTEAQGNERFFIHNGPVVKDMLELKKAFENMTQDQYNFHVTKEKNDFALWVEYILHDKQCARAIKKARTIKTSIRAVDQSLQKYKQYA